MSTKNFICTKSALLANGILHTIRLYSPESSVEVKNSFAELIKDEDLSESNIFIDLHFICVDLIPGLEKLRQRIFTGQIIGILDKNPSDRLQCLLDYSIRTDSSNEVLHSIFEKILSSQNSINGETEDNKLISVREIEILKYVALGLTNKEIANQLNISTHTVITHRKNITAKLGIKTIAGLTVYAILNNIIKAEEIN